MELAFSIHKEEKLGHMEENKWRKEGYKQGKKERQ